MHYLEDAMEAYRCERCGGSECAAEVPIRGAATVHCQGPGTWEFDLEDVDFELDCEAATYATVEGVCGHCGHRQVIWSP
jgi:hypothetical protein